MSARDDLEAAARKWLVGHYAALKDGPGIPQKVISDLADFAEAHAAQVGVIAVKRADDVPDEPLDVSQVDPAIGETAAALAVAAGQTPKRPAPAKPATRRRLPK